MANRLLRFPRKPWQHFLKWDRTGPDSIFSFQEPQGLLAARRAFLHKAEAPRQELLSQSMEICLSARCWLTEQRQRCPPALTLTSSPRRRSRNFRSALPHSRPSTASEASYTTRSVREARTASTDRYTNIFR